MPYDKDDQGACIIASTVVIISKDMKALILKRSATETRLPNLWSVAGGKLKVDDGEYIGSGVFTNVAEETALRELQEETGLFASYFKDKLKYLTTVVACEDIKRFIITFYAVVDFNANELHVQTEGQEYQWITENEISNYEFIKDVDGELREVFRLLRNKNMIN